MSLLGLRDWYRLTKPGIVYGNSLHALAGILFGAAFYDWNLLSAVGALLGIGLVIASACVANNYLDRQIDAQMKRTQKRASAAGRLSLKAAICGSAGLGLSGLVILVLTTNWLTVSLGLVAYIFYVWIYGYAKRTTIHSTLVGAIPGALPAVAGYTALSGRLDLMAWVIFGLIFIWQLPHFYAIAIFRRHEYAQAELPIISCRWPLERIVSLIRLSAGIFWLLALVSAIYLLVWWAGIILLLAASVWLAITLQNFSDIDKWSRRVFVSSLIVTLLLVLVGAINLALVRLTTLY